MGVGRPAKPTALKLIEGNKGKRPLNKKEPKALRKQPTKPKHLTPFASEFWDRIVSLLEETGVLAGVDEVAIERVAEIYSDIRIAQQSIRREGATYAAVTGSGETMIKGNPAVQQLRAADQQLKGYLTEFGLTPASRSRIEIAAPDGEEDKADRHFG